MAPSDKKTSRTLMLGSEACARGAMEAGVRLAIGYPGTPATPAMDYLIKNRGEDLRAEWAVNEKVALEIAIGHSWAGQRSFFATKMSGLNAACDSLLSLATSGTRGGLVILVGDDPGVYYGMVEQDSRLLARLSMLPMVEPSTPEEARILAHDAFDVSEKTGAPVIIRQTTTTAATLGEVNLDIPVRAKRKSSLPNDPRKYTKAGALACRAQHKDALRRLKDAGRELAHWNLLKEGDGRLGIIAAASVWPYVEEALGEKEASGLHALKVAVMNPLPDERIAALIEKCDRILVLEELETLVEERVRYLAHILNRRVDVIGKGLLPETGDFDPDLVGYAVNVLMGRRPEQQPEPNFVESYAPRKPAFCPGCPHRSTYFALRKAIKDAGFKQEDVMVTGDVGCTILGMDEPFSLCRTELVMGASIAMAQGFVYAGLDTPVIAAIGDSTFFHSGIPALINAASRDVDMTVIIMDNNYAAMTGFQPTVATTSDALDLAPVKPSIAELVKAARVKRFRALSPYFHNRLSKVITQALKTKGVDVILCEAPCVAKKKPSPVIPFSVKEKACRGTEECGFKCLEGTGCLALGRDDDTGKALIRSERCIGCGLCADCCPYKAIQRRIGFMRRFA